MAPLCSLVVVDFAPRLLFGAAADNDATSQRQVHAFAAASRQLFFA